MKKIKKASILIMMFLSVCVFSGFAYAGTNDTVFRCDGIANTNEIDLSDEKLYKCRDLITNPVNIENLISYTGSINKAYEVLVYHFYVPKTGYYSIYTTGHSDTLIRLYREKQKMWWIEGFIGDFEKQDDGSMCDSNYRNACCIEKLFKGYYYAAVRIYGSSTGSFEINMGPNEDLLYRNKYPEYRVWTRKKDTSPTTSSEFSVVKKREYFTGEETLMLYWLLSDNAAFTINIGEYADEYGKPSITSKELMKLYKERETASLAVNIAGVVFGVICSIVQAPAGVSIAATVIPFIMTTALDLGNQKDCLNKIATECEIEFEIINIENQSANIKMYSKRNLLLEGLYENLAPTNNLLGYRYSSWDNNDMYYRGVKNEAGSWSKE